MTSSRRIAACALAALLVGGCAPDPPGASPRTVSSTPPTSSSTTRGEISRPTVAPPVSRALDVGPFRAHPCDLLTSEQQNALSLPPRTVDRFDICGWEKSQPKESVTVQLMVSLSYLAQVYLESNTEWVTFEPVTVAGQPAVVLNPTTNQAYSSVLVGTGPTDSVSVSVTSDGPDPRARVTAIATQIVENLAR